MRDITEAKRLQVKMTSTDRLATVGTLAAGVAHEINNPLACVLANLSYALSILGDLPLEVRGSLEETVDALQGARDGAERIRQTCRDIKLFSGGAGDEESGPTEVGPVLESALAMAASEPRHRAKVVRTLEPVPTVDIGQNRLGQVLLNLILNAAQAIPDGLPAENEIHVSTQVRGRRVVIAIRDTGCGMTPIVRARIFEPFYTTKAVGTGLGLSICKGIIEKLGGQIEVESAVGAGTTFRVILPIGKL